MVRDNRLPFPGANAATSGRRPHLRRCARVATSRLRAQTRLLEGPSASAAGGIWACREALKPALYLRRPLVAPNLSLDVFLGGDGCTAEENCHESRVYSSFSSSSASDDGGPSVGRGIGLSAAKVAMANVRHRSSPPPKGIPHRSGREDL